MDGVTPHVSDLRMAGQAPDSTLVMLMEADFTDPDGDLGDGNLETYIDANPTSLGGLSLRPIFIRSGLPLEAAEGTLDFVLELSVTESLLPDSGTQFSLGVVLIDLAGNASERAEVQVALTY